MPIKPIDIEKLSDKAQNIHEAIVAMSKRTRQINEEMKIEFNQRIELVASKTEVDSAEETDVNPDQLRISLEFEKRPKPTDLALDEMLNNKIKWRYKEPEVSPLASEDESETE